MIATATMRNRATVYVAAAVCFIFFFMFLRLPGGSSTISAPPSMGGAATAGGGTSAGARLAPLHVSEGLVHGGVIMPKLGNETIKAELGRASWKLFHTMLARFPEKPTRDERDALSNYIHLFARLYPCGDCAAHFRLILEKFPPQTSSREAAGQWGCHVHNQVNERLKKEIFDCNSIADKYKCGCAEEDEKEGSAAGGSGAAAKSATASSSSAGAMKTKFGPDRAGDELIKKKKVKAKKADEDEEEQLNLEREGLTRGG